MADPTSRTILEYSRQAHEYELKWKNYLMHTHQALIKSMNIKEKGSLCDLSCGTGLFTYQLFEQFPELELIQLNDLSEGMIEQAKERFHDHPNVVFSHLHAQDVGQLQTSFDTIISLNAFHNYENQQEVLDACFEVLNPDGKLYILDWNRTGMFRFTNRMIKAWVPEHIDTRSAYELYEMLHESGFELTHINSWSWRYWKFYLIEAEKPSA